eukprot:UN01724
MAPASNPYLDASVTDNFLTADESQKFIEKYEKPKTKSNIASACDQFRDKMGFNPRNAIQFLGFCEQNNIKCTYSECSQYIQFIKKQNPEEESDSDAEYDEEEDGDVGYGIYDYQK